MEILKDTITWKEFVDDPTVSPNTRRIRKAVIRDLSKANGFESPQLLLDAIKLDQLTPYSAARKYISGLIAPVNENGGKKLKIGSVALYRSVLPTFFKSVLGSKNFDTDTFNRLVKIGDVWVEVEKKARTRLFL